ncbi:MAG: type IIL restriction-modification enzyme MmeI, partial [Flavobacterium sp.]
LIGSSEFIRGEYRYCLWLEDEDLSLLKDNAIVQQRIQKTESHRLSSKDEGTKLLALRSHQFRDRNIASNTSILVPRVSSERRDYIPMGIMDKTFVILDSAMAIYDAKPYMLSVLHSKIHMVWVDTIGGKLKTDYRYSAKLCYNTFPFPKITKAKEQELEECAYRILEVRERYPEKTLAQLYDPGKMPADLKEAHQQNDIAVESCYREKPFASDEERLEYLFKLYEKMIKDEKKKK